MTTRPIVFHLLHKRFVEHTSTVLLLGRSRFTFSGLSYNIVYWFRGS